MSENKNAWIVCHDLWLDHRLYFFFDSLTRLGFNCNIVAEHLPYLGTPSIDRRPTARAEQSILNLPPDKIMTSDIEALLKLRQFSVSDISSFLATFRTIHSNGSRENVVRNGFQSWATDRDAVVGNLIGADGITVMRMDSMNRRLEVAVPYTEAQKRDFQQTCGYYDEAFAKTVYDYSALGIKCGSLAQIHPPSLIIAADLPCMPVATHWAKKLCAPLIFDGHEWWSEQYNVWGDGKVEMYRAIDRFEKFYYPKADVHLTVGKKLASAMAAHFALDFNEIYTCNVIQDENYPANEKIWSSLIPGYAGERILLFQGNLTAKRNIELLPKIGAQLAGSNVILVVAGDGPMREDLEIAIKKNNLKRQVHLLGWLNQGALAQVTESADLGFVPYVAISDYYAVGAPNKVFEYVSAKLPFVYDRSMREIDSIASTFNIGVGMNMADPATVADQIVNLLNSSASIEGLKSGFGAASRALSTNAQHDVFRSLIASTDKIRQLLEP